MILYEVWHHQGADTCQKTTNRGVLFELLFQAESEAYHCTVLYYTALHYTTLHYTTLHYTTLHYTTIALFLFL